MPRPPATLLATALGLGLAAALAPDARAGGGPETTIVVANADSPTSLRIANEYVRMRRIPATHLVTVVDVPSLSIVSVDVFREKLWRPVRVWLDANDPKGRIDCIAWSGDLPYGVDFASDPAPTDTFGISPIASLTGMTFLARRVERRDSDGYLSLTANGYYRRYADQAAGTATREERELLERARTSIQAQQWGAAAAALSAVLRTYRGDDVAFVRYNLACCLARVGRAGDALEELGRAVDAGFEGARTAREDPDLATLRARAEFDTLLARMEEAARARSTLGTLPARGFASRYAWTGADLPDVAPTDSSPDRYWLSTMLGFTGPRGNGTPEVLRALESAAASDGTKPDGTVYFCESDDVARTGPRQPRFASAVAALEALGRRARVVRKGTEGQTGVLPIGCDDVVGAVVGIAAFSWPECKSRMLPGAIAEHLTSYGAAFAQGDQTQLSEFVRHGAAGSSGAVAEPYNLAAKFPVPHLHVHYAEGCSRAEAFFQSVRGPDQLLVVGDPLARPFAEFAQVFLEAPWPEGSAPLSGRVEVRASVTGRPDRPVASVELWVDGRYAGESAAGSAIAWDTTAEEDGAHEIRVVAVESHRIGTRTSSAPAIVTVANGKSTPPTLVGPSAVPLDGMLSLLGHASGVRDVQVFAGSRLLTIAPVRGDAWKASVPAVRLGAGESTLWVRALGAAGSGVRSGFLVVRVTPPTLRRAQKPLEKFEPGLRATWNDATGKPQTGLLTTLGGQGAQSVAQQLAGKVKGTATALTVDGQFEVPSSGLWQLNVGARGRLVLEVDGRPTLALAKGAAAYPAFALLSLEAGRHSLRLDYVPDGGLDLSVMLAGEQPAAPLRVAQLFAPAR